MVDSGSTKHDWAIDSFSGKLGPVFVKELRQGLRAQRFTIPFLTIHALAILAVTMQFLIKYFTDVGATSSPYALGILYSGISDHLLMTLLWLMVGVIMPLTGINALQSELAGGRNVELLLMAGLTRWQIMRGKWLVLCVLSALILMSMLPYLLTLYFTGGFDLVGQLEQLLMVGAFNIIMSAIIIGASGFRHLLGRLVIIGMTFFSYSFTLPIVLYNPSLSSSWSLPGWVGYLLSHLLIIALYVVYGLQLGRARLRLYEDPIDPPATGLVITMIIFTPVVAGLFRVIGGSIGSLIVLAGLTALGLMLDSRSPRAKVDTGFAQP